MKLKFTVTLLAGIFSVTLLLTGCVSPNIPIVPIIKNQTSAAAMGDDVARLDNGEHFLNQVS